MTYYLVYYRVKFYEEHDLVGDLGHHIRLASKIGTQHTLEQVKYVPNILHKTKTYHQIEYLINYI